MHTFPTSTTAMLAGVLCLVGVPLHAQEARVTTLMTRALSDVPGKEVLMLTVDYAPGGMDASHRHDADVFVYVLEGSVVEQVKGGKPVTLTVGQTFYEGPGDVHVVSRNASRTRPARLLAILVKRTGAPVLVPAERTGRRGR